jgi:hypothetical protein
MLTKPLLKKYGFATLSIPWGPDVFAALSRWRKQSSEQIADIFQRAPCEQERALEKKQYEVAFLP